MLFWDEPPQRAFLHLSRYPILKSSYTFWHRDRDVCVHRDRIPVCHLAPLDVVEGKFSRYLPSKSLGRLAHGPSLLFVGNIFDKVGRRSALEASSLHPPWWIALPHGIIILYGQILQDQGQMDGPRSQAGRKRKLLGARIDPYSSSVGTLPWDLVYSMQ